MKSPKKFLLWLLFFLILSSTKVLATNYWYFNGTTINKRGQYPYLSSQHLKYNRTTQKYTSNDCKDTLFWRPRNLSVQLFAENSTASSLVYELPVKSTANFNKETLKEPGVYYYLKFKIPNFFVNEVYIIGTWNID